MRRLTSRCLSTALAALLTVALRAQQPSPSEPPNVVLIYADDLGWGDVGFQGATAVATPNIDRLAGAGLRFRDAHSAAATCTPSRYALLTGEYAFRRRGTGVLPGDAKLIVAPGRTTLASVLQRAGYRTAVVGKWHLGLGDGDLDWNGKIAPGPLEVGFDECLLVPATGDRVPCVYVDGHAVRGLETTDPLLVSYAKRLGDEPSGKERPDLLRMRWAFGHDQTIVDGISRIGWMTGGAKARWRDEDMADVLTARALEFLRAHRDRRFLLWFSTHDIHVPRVPHPRFRGRTAMGPRGDAIVQFDWCVGAILDALDELHLADRTLVILTSDNGAVVGDGYEDEAVARLGEHRPSGPWRGGKYSAFEGGTRVPFVVRWLGRVKPGESGALIGQVDLLHSLAKLVGQPLAAADAPDSVDQLAALLGDQAAGRDHLVLQAGALSLREGRWKYVPPGKGAAADAATRTELGNDPADQLYDLEADPGERQNLAEKEPQRTATMRERLLALREAGRSR